MLLSIYYELKCTYNVRLHLASNRLLVVSFNAVYIKTLSSGHKCTTSYDWLSYTKIEIDTEKISKPLRKDDMLNRKAFHIFFMPESCLI